MSSPPFKAHANRADPYRNVRYALPELEGNAIAIRTLKLENEGWQRDDGVIEPAAASFGDPPS